MTADASPTPAAPRWQRRGWAALVLAYGLCWLVVLVMPWPRSDFDAYHRAAERVGRGENPYRLDEFGIHGTYRYPPAFAYLMIPFGQLDLAWAGRLWFGVNLLALAGCLLLALHLAYGPRPWPPGAGAVALAAAVAAGFYASQNLFQGQVGLVMTAACLGWAACRRAGRNFAGGLLLAAGCALKLAPAVLVPYLVLRRDWRGLAGVAVGGAVFVLAPAPWVGVDGAVRLHRDWARHAKETQVPEQNYRPGNQGLMGVLARLPHVSNGRVCFSETELAALDRAYPLLVVGLAAALYGWVAWDLRARGGADPGCRGENLHLSLLVVFMTLAHPCAWRCNFAPLILPVVVLARHALASHRAGVTPARLALVTVTLGWAWSVVAVVVALPGNWATLGGQASLVDIILGRLKTGGWSFGTWVLQGAHFWTALLVGWACWRVVDR